MNRTLRLAFLALPGLLLGACAQVDSGSPVAMGPGSETSGLQVRLLNAQGEPARKVEIKAVAVDEWSAKAADGRVVLARATTDDSGRARLEDLPNANLALEADLGSAVVRQELRAGDTAAQTLVLRNGGMMLLRLRGDTAGIAKLLLDGTAFEARRQSDGCWVFPWAPQGTYTLVAFRHGAMQPLAQVRADSLRGRDTTLQVRTTTFLDDFQTQTRQNIFGQRLGGGYWFAASEGGASSKSPISTPDLASAHEPGWMGSSFHVQFQVDTLTTTGNVSVLGMDFATAKEGRTDVLRDLSRLDSVIFMTRGRGTVDVRLIGAGGCPLIASLTLPDAWKRIALGAEDFHPGAGCTQNNAELVRIGGLGFAARHDAELWLDNLELLGVSPRVLFPELP